MPECDWDKFLTTARTSLPLTFRITGTRLMAESVLACLEQRCVVSTTKCGHILGF